VLAIDRALVPTMQLRRHAAYIGFRMLRVSFAGANSLAPHVASAMSDCRKCEAIPLAEPASTYCDGTHKSLFLRVFADCARLRRSAISHDVMCSSEYGVACSNERRDRDAERLMEKPVLTTITSDGMMRAATCKRPLAIPMRALLGMAASLLAASLCSAADSGSPTIGE
jgi:hypothetical protein